MFGKRPGRAERQGAAKLDDGRPQVSNTAPYQESVRQRTMSGGKGDTWIEAGLAELARSGVEGVRVEVLAKNLGVTKGGFYRRFKDRAALLEGILQNWSAGRSTAIAQQT